MSFQIGGGRPGPLNCIEDVLSWSTDVAYYISNLIDATQAGAVDTFKFSEADGGTPGFWNEKVAGEMAFNPELHQEVYWSASGGIISLHTVAGGGEGGGDTYQVKVNSGGSPGFLDTKIHANTYQASDAYGSGTHFFVSASPVGDAVRFYAPYNIIKTSAGDSSPGYLADKMANPGTYNGSTHVLAETQNTGSTIRIFTAKTAITTVVDTYLATATVGNLRFCKVEPGDVNVATESGGDITPGSCASMTEMAFNPSNGKLEPGDPLTNILYPSVDPVYIPTGRHKIGRLKPFAGDPTKLALDVDCRSIAD